MGLDTLIAFIENLPNVVLERPWGDDNLVYKIGGKLFVIVSLDNQPNRLNLKNLPEKNIELREKYSWIEYGYHMNKQHWNSIYLTTEADLKLIENLIKDSYDLVFSSLTNKIKNELQKHGN